MNLTDTQALALRCYATGEPRWTRPNTIDALRRRGLIEYRNGRVHVTLSGRSVLVARGGAS